MCIGIVTIFIYVLITDPIISTFWFLILSMKMGIFSIIIKAINDVIITRNDFISTLITISVTCIQIIDNDARNNGQCEPMPIIYPVINQYFNKWCYCGT